MESENQKLLLREEKTFPIRAAGVQVRTDLRVGDWQCRDCSGQISGDQMLNPSCDYCQGA